MIRIILIITLSLLCLGCGATGAKTTATTAHTETIDDKAEKILSSMKLSEKIGQMVMMGVHGEDITDDSRFLLQQYHIGGVIFFDRNMKNPAQVKKFIANLKAAGDKKAPMLFALDEEGGLVARMKDGLTAPPPAGDIGKTGDPSVSYSAMKKTADEMKAIGFNVNFAPVADLALNKNRSFSTDGKTVALFTNETIRAINDGGLIGTLKHFPGLGGATVDTHKGTAVVNKTKAELLANDLLPYINANHDYNYFIMVGHGTYPALDELPAGFSKAIVTDLLRGELKYDGVVVTDDLNMGAITMFNEEERAVRAINAGVDIILSCHDYKMTEKMYLAILDAAEKGEITENRINQSVKRILKAKIRLEK
ncbi:MAG: beta-N-acetylhexosaminidase [Selenomonadaceae bacterium]|nr:beta-N-acetylhexosaminidase [Selenomonadaceae bacterium]MBP3722603.1 beta-N-acetylhexosaminidase [Selenomonadaceae bacterium]